MKTKTILRHLLILAMPVMAQNMLYSSLTFMDVLMIGQLGESAIASAGIAGQLIFIFSIIQFGIHTGISVHTAQAWGRRETEKIGHLLGIQIFIGFIPALIFTAVIYLCPNLFINLFTDDKSVADGALGYLKITGAGLIFSALTSAFTHNLRSTEEVRLPLFTSVLSVSINLMLNYLLIFGKWGLPVLGIQGAAVATVSARIIEAVVLISLVYRKELVPAVPVCHLFGFSAACLKRVLKTSWPVFMNEFCWVAGISVYTWVYSTLGTESLAAVNIVLSVENFVFTPFFGILSAGAVLIGGRVGAGKKEEAYSYGRIISLFQFFLALITGFLLLLFRNNILSLYSISEATGRFGNALLIVIGVIMSLRILNYNFNVSVFRGGGDTGYSLFLDFSGSWLVGIPLAFAGAFLFNLPVYGVMALAAVEEVYKVILAVRRFRSGRWIRILSH